MFIQLQPQHLAILELELELPAVEPRIVLMDNPVVVRTDDNWSLLVESSSYPVVFSVAKIQIILQNHAYSTEFFAKTQVNQQNIPHSGTILTKVYSIDSS